MRVVPSTTVLLLLGAVGGAALAALLAGVAQPLVTQATAFSVLALGSVAVADYILSRRRWLTANCRYTRQLPPAFAIGVERTVRVTLAQDGPSEWHCVLFDHVDPTVDRKSVV